MHPLLAGTRSIGVSLRRVHSIGLNIPGSLDWIRIAQLARPQLGSTVERERYRLISCQYTRTKTLFRNAHERYTSDTLILEENWNKLKRCFASDNQKRYADLGQEQVSKKRHWRLLCLVAAEVILLSILSITYVVMYFTNGPRTHADQSNHISRRGPL